MPVEQPRNPLHDDQLIDTIGTVQSELRGDVELGAMDRYHQAPVESWLLALRHDIDKALTVRGVSATVSVPNTAHGVGNLTNRTED